METSFSIVIRCVISDRAGRVLVLNATPDTTRIKTWNLISGCPTRADRTIEHAVHRIIRDDTGISDAYVRLHGSRIDGSIIEFWYLCSVDQAALVHRELPSALSWCPASIISNADCVPAGIVTMVVRHACMHMDEL